jgi:Fic family protein
MKKIDVSTVLQTHKILMTSQPLGHHEIGYFRKEPVYIGGREGRPWFAIPELIFDWCYKVNLDKPLFSEAYIKQMHVDYERIHPFIDGNGRTGRIFMNWQRLKLGLPLLVIKEAEKQDYYAWFE